MINIGSLGDLYAEWPRTGAALKINQSSIGFWTHLHSGEIRRRFFTAMTTLTQAYTRQGSYMDRQEVERGYRVFDQCSWRPRLALFTDLHVPPTPEIDHDREHYLDNDISWMFPWLRKRGCENAWIDRNGALWYQLDNEPWRRQTPGDGQQWLFQGEGAPGEDRAIPFSREHFAILAKWAHEEGTILDHESRIHPRSQGQTYGELIAGALPKHDLIQHILAPQDKSLGKPLLDWVAEMQPQLARDLFRVKRQRRRTAAAPQPFETPNWFGLLLARPAPRYSAVGGRGGWSHGMAFGGDSHAAAAIIDRDQMYERREAYMLEYFSYETRSDRQYGHSMIAQELDISPPTEHRGGGRVPPEQQQAYAEPGPLGQEMIYAQRGRGQGMTHVEAARRAFPQIDFRSALATERMAHRMSDERIRGERLEGVVFDEETDPPPPGALGMAILDSRAVLNADFT